MIRALRAEAVKLLRPRVLVLAALGVVVFAVGGTAIVVSAAEPAATAVPGRGVTIEALSEPGGGTEAFRTAASFAGFFLFVVFAGTLAAEFSRGTIRTMLLRQPRRSRLLGGKLLAHLSFAAVLLASGLALAWVTARLLGPGQGVSTGEWMSLAALGHALADYGAMLFWVTGYALFGTALAVVLRSVPLALGVGIAWAGPFEHLLQDAWEPASRIFPGLLLEAFVAGGTPDVGAARAFVTVAAYAGVAAAVATLHFARRDAVA